MARPDARCQRGLSLLESLVALAVTGLLAGLALEGVAASRRLVERSGRQAAVAERIEGAQMALRRQLTRAFPETRMADGIVFTDFDGTSDRLAFVAPPPAAAGPGPLQGFSLFLDGAGSLVLAAAGTRQVLLDHVARLDLAYADDRGQWQASWRQRSELPALIRVELEFPAGDGRWWPGLLVHPAIGLDADCVLADRGTTCEGR